jgi:hypothetical protein
MCRCLRRVIWELFPARHCGAELDTSSARGKKSPADRTLEVSAARPIGLLSAGITTAHAPSNRGCRPVGTSSARLVSVTARTIGLSSS